jgi:hypothetical protein
MAVTALTPTVKPSLISPTITTTTQISNGTPAAASPERTAERYERWLITQKKLDLGGSVGLVKIAPNKTVIFPFEVRRQGWTSQVEIVFWIASFKTGKPTVTAFLNIATSDDPTGLSFVISGTQSASAADATRYSATLDIGAGDRTDEQTLTSAVATITTSNEDASDVYVYGRTIHQLPFLETTMELAP